MLLKCPKNAIGQLANEIAGTAKEMAKTSQNIMDRVAARILGFLIWITNKGEINQIGCIDFPEFRIFGVMVELRHPGPRGRWFEPGRWLNWLRSRPFIEMARNRQKSLAKTFGCKINDIFVRFDLLI